MNSPFACPILSVVYYAGGIKSIPASERKFPKLNLLHKNNTNALPKAKSTDTHDFGEGSISGNILRLAIPMTLAQLINVLYNIIDRIYIGHIPGVGAAALTGVGLFTPILMLIRSLQSSPLLPICSVWAAHRFFLWQEVPVNLRAPGKVSATPFPCS